MTAAASDVSSDTGAKVGGDEVNIVKTKKGTITRIDVQGVIKLGESAQQFSDYLEKVLTDDTGPVLVNFEGIDYLDSTGLGELIGFLQKFEDRDRKMALLKPKERILSLLKVTRLDSVFKIFNEDAAAEQYLES